MVLRWLSLLVLAAAASSFAIEPSPAVVAVASYAGADRTERLIAGARKGGELMLYSSLTQDDQLRIAADFQRRYCVNVKLWRVNQAHMLQRVVSESRSGHLELDLLDDDAY